MRVLELQQPFMKFGLGKVIFIILKRVVNIVWLLDKVLRSINDVQEKGRGSD